MLGPVIGIIVSIVAYQYAGLPDAAYSGVTTWLALETVFLLFSKGFEQ